MAGSGGSGYSGDGGLATNATLFQPGSVAVDSLGRVYIADSSNSRVRRVNADGRIQTVAGGGTLSLSRLQFYLFLGDPVSALSLYLDAVGDIAVDTQDVLYVAASSQGAGTTYIKVLPNGMVQLASRFCAFDQVGNIYYASANRIYRTSTVIAGTGVQGFSGDNSPGLAAQLSDPGQVALDRDGSLYIADVGNRRLRKLSRDGTITTVVGSGQRAFGDARDKDGGPAGQTSLGLVNGLAFTSTGGLVFSEMIGDGNFEPDGQATILNRIRKVAAPPATGGEMRIDGVVNAADFGSRTSPGSWASIFGVHLTDGQTRAWRADEIINGVLPTSLDGISVRVNGRLAALCFISPGQINFQVPDVDTASLATIQVTKSSGSASGLLDVQSLSPALFTIGTINGKYLAAAVHLDGTLVGDPAVLPGSRRARGGDTVMVFGGGFGPSTPTVPSGVVAAPAPLASTVNCTILVVNCTVSYSGLVGPGLNQFNIRIPTLATGYHPLSLTVGGTSSQLNVVIPVQLF
jgi:uncharacterized protein (TIGR03437 family)